MSGPTLKPSDHTAALEILDAGGNRLKAPSTLNTLSMPKLTSCGIATLLAKVGSRLSRDTSERWGEKSWSFCGLVYCARAEEQIKSIAAPGRSINLSVSKLAAPEILIGVSNSWLAQPRRISGLPSRALLPPDFRNRALELKSAGASALSVNCGTRAGCSRPGAVAKTLSGKTGVFCCGVANIASKRLSWPPSRPALLLAVCAIANPA